VKENSKVTDTNVGDIEENIEELKRLLYRDELTQYGKRKLINYYEQQEKDYKRVLKENEELKRLVAHKNGYTKKLEEDLFENCSNYVIPKQKVKDKIEEYKKMLLSCNRFSDVDRIKAINERILELQELLEGRE
jgi:hypothetical protein